MITAGTGLRISGGGSLYFTPGAQGAGQVRYNTTYNTMEVWDGNTWMRLATPHIELDDEVRNIINWARNRKMQDEKLSELCQQHPGLHEARERFEIMLQLVKKEST
jgi:hypothetical protein